MIFQINQYSTLPVLQMELINDNRVSFNQFHECIQNAVITFCMTDTKTGAKIVGNKPALCILKENLIDPLQEEYLIGYQFTEKETKKSGVFIGQFTIEFNDGSGKLLVPIKEELEIHILDSSIKK